MKLLIDADACPVYKKALDVANEYNIEAHLFFDTTHTFDSSIAILHVCDKGSDSVDYELLKNVNEGDIVITQDYGLACLVLSKRAYPINQNGLIYTNQNIDQLLESRYIGSKIRKAGGRTKGPSKRTKENDDDFIRSLRKLINNLVDKKL